MADTDTVLIFDTTLRDGEQSPGVALNIRDKLEIAHQLQRLGVDIIEAGFPASSPGDFEAVKAVATEVRETRIAGLARAEVLELVSDLQFVADVQGHARRLLAVAQRRIEDQYRVGIRHLSDLR